MRGPLPRVPTATERLLIGLGDERVGLYPLKSQKPQGQLHLNVLGDVDFGDATHDEDLQALAVPDVKMLE